VTPLLDILTGWLLFGGLVTCWGAITGRWLLVPPYDIGRSISESHAEVSLGVAMRLGRMGGVALPVALSLVFLRQFQEFRDPFASWVEDAQLLAFGTNWGTTWIFGFAASLLVMAAFLSLKWTRQAGWVMAALLTVALSAFPALTGHANGTEGLRWISISGDLIHVSAAGVWIGGLTLVLLSERAWKIRDQSANYTLLPELVPVFSRVALPAVVILLLTGTLAAWMHLPSLGALITTSYGRTLMVKLGLVFIVLSIGLLNWRRITPRLLDVDGPRAMRKSAALELLFAHAVLLVTAVLTRTSPMDH
tara:strand:- start:3365 stop:4282 length:918 start_codon:yes stop_codon:yes gene_type:complete